MTLEQYSYAITCFNGEATIHRAVMSCLNQTHAPAEILVVDDGSDDKSVEIIRELQAQYSKIKLICHQTNQGVSAARNSCLKHVSTDLFLFLDSDDEADAERGELQVLAHSALEHKYPGGHFIIYCDRDVFRKGVFSRSVNGVSTPGANFVSSTSMAAYQLWQKTPVPVKGFDGTCTMSMRLATARVFDLAFDTSFLGGEDQEFALRAAFAGVKFARAEGAKIRQFITPKPHKSRTLYKHVATKIRLNLIAFSQGHRPARAIFNLVKLGLKYVYLRAFRS